MNFGGVIIKKPIVEVIVHFNLEGEIVPLKVDYKGSILYVGKPSKPKKGASQTMGVQGNRYECLIDGKKAHLYLTYENKWYLEFLK